MKLREGYVFTGVCDSVHGGRGRAWLPGVHGCWGACVVAGGHVWLQGACMVARGHAWLWGACAVAGGVCGGGCAWLPGGVRLLGACMVAEGCAWLLGGMRGCWRGHAWLLGGMCGCWGVCVVTRGACIGYDDIRSMSGWYASYWNAFLLPQPHEVVRSNRVQPVILVTS